MALKGPYPRPILRHGGVIGWISKGLAALGANPGINPMTGGSDRRYISRILAMVLVGLVFAACASMVLRGERSLFAETAGAEIAR